jgi:hypothetical protein
MSLEVAKEHIEELVRTCNNSPHGITPDGKIDVPAIKSCELALDECRALGDEALREMEEVTDGDAEDAARFRWLIRQGVAWRGCYGNGWGEGEWLYEGPDARCEIDREMMPNAQDHTPEEARK